MSKTVIDGVDVPGACGRFDSHGFVHKVENQKSEESEGQTAVIEVVSLVPGFCAGQNSRDDKAQCGGEEEGQENSGKGQGGLPENVRLL